MARDTAATAAAATVTSNGSLRIVHDLAHRPLTTAQVRKLPPDGAAFVIREIIFAGSGPRMAGYDYVSIFKPASAA